MLPFIQKNKYIVFLAAAVVVALVIAFITGGALSPQEPSSTPPYVPTSHTAVADADNTVTPVDVQSTAASSGTTAASSAATGTTNPSSTAAAGRSTSTTAAAVVTTTQPAATAAQESRQTVPASTVKPQPVETQAQETKVNKKYCTISISCATAWNRRGEWSAAVAEAIPANGTVLAPAKVIVYEGESVFDVLKRACRNKNIPMEFTATPVYNTAYIEGIGNLYEFDCGSGSGWMYKVNGWFPNYGCSRYTVQNGDVIEWVYTCNLGRDIGGENIQYTD